MKKQILHFLQLVILCVISTQIQAQTVADFAIYAGTGLNTSVDPIMNNVAATSVNLNNAVFHMAVGNNGNIYFSLWYTVTNNRTFIKKIDANGIMTNVAGTGVTGSSGDNGNALNAQVNPGDLIVDANDNIYFINGNTQIRKINSSGIISTLYTTPSGQIGSLAFAPDGNLYFGYESGTKIRKLNLSNLTSIDIAGNGTSGYSGDGGSALSASFVNARDLVVDGSGNIYFSEGGLRIRKIDMSTGIISTVAGSGTVTSLTNGMQASTIKNTVQNGLAMYNNEVYFTTSSQGIWKIISDGTITQVVSNPSLGNGMGQDIEVNSSGEVFSTFASNTFKGYVLKSCIAISSQPLVSQSVCINSPVTSLSVSSGLSSTYQWFSNVFNNNSGGTLISGAISSTYTPPNNTANTRFYYCTVSNSCGTKKSSTAQVNIIALPTANAGNTTTLCQSANPVPITLSGSSIGGSATTGSWSILSGGGVLSNTNAVSNPAVVTYTPDANYAGNVLLQLQSNDPNGCGVATSTKSITVNALPTIPVIAASTTTVNIGSSVTLSIASGNLNGANTWSWYANSCNGNFVGTGTSITVTPCGTTTYYARATGGCASANGTCDSITITVNTNNQNFFPQINQVTVNGEIANSISNNPMAFNYTVCGASSVQISLTNAQLNQAANWVWYSGSCGSAVIGTGSSITLPASSNQTYYVRGEGGNTCVANVSCTPITVNVNPAVSCQNGGVAVNCGCDCLSGYAGPHCENVALVAAALDFDGINDYAALADPQALNFSSANTFTFEGWVKPLTPWSSSNSSNNFIFSKLDANTTGYALFTSGSQLQFILTHNFQNNEMILVQTTTGTLLDGAWHHFAVSYDGSSTANGLQIYLDGVAQNLQVMADALSSSLSIQNSVPFTLGSSPFGSYRGQMDELRVWSDVRTPSLLTQRMNCEVSNAPNLLLSYHFNEGLGGSNNVTPTLFNTIPDAGPNNYTATLFNFNLKGSTSNWQEPGAVTSGVSCCIIPDAPSINVIGAADCPNMPIQLQIANSQSLYSATQWEWFEGNCGGTAIATGSTVTLTPTGSTTYYVRATGGCVNNATCGVINLTLIDTTAPSILCGADTTVYANASGCMYNGALALPQVSDYCGGVTLSAPNPAPPYALGTTTVVWTATDLSNNISTCSRQITVLPLTSSGSSNENACGAYTWLQNANTSYNVSGSYQATFMNQMGCDSIHTLNLTINSNSTSTNTESACGSYYWTVTGLTYTQSGTYTFLGTTPQGCSDTKILNLTINPKPTVSTNDVTTCPGVSVNLVGNPAGGTFSIPNPYNGPATTFTYTYTDALGCSATSAPAQFSYYNNAPPTGITVVEDGTSAAVSWVPASTLNNFAIRYRVVGAVSWNTVNVTGSSTTLNNLVTCSAYELQIQTLCTGGNGGTWSSIKNFNTSSKAPITLNAAVLNTTCTLSWTAVAGTGFYGTRYRRTNPIGAWVTGTTNAPNKQLAGLPRNACYEYQVQSFCPSATVGSAWSASRTFCTAGAAPFKSNTSLNEEQASYLIYPNPVSSLLNIEFESASNQKNTIKILDLSGRVIKVYTAVTEEGKQHVEMNVNNLETGMYLVHVYENETLVQVTKVLVQP